MDGLSECGALEELVIFALITSASVQVRPTVISVHVCLSVCLFVGSHISKTTHQNFHQFFCTCYMTVAVAPSSSDGQCR